MWVKKAQNGWNFLSRSFQPFPFVSACGSRCGSSTILEDFLDEAKPPQTAVLRGFCGAAIQIRTGDLILTNTLRYVQVVLSGTIWAFFIPFKMVSSGISPTVSTQFFRVWGGVWVKRQNSKQNYEQKSQKSFSKFAPLNKEDNFPLCPLNALWQVHHVMPGYRRQNHPAPGQPPPKHQQPNRPKIRRHTTRLKNSHDPLL